MPLILALKNRHSIVVGCDAPSLDDRPGPHSCCLVLPNRSVLLVAGNLAAVRPTLERTVLPRVTAGTSAAASAQIVQAALVLEVVPGLDELAGRVEIIVAGIDPVRHAEQPGLYYLDSDGDFRLHTARGDALAAGSTAAVSGLLAGHSFQASSTDQLAVLAKECLAATKLRWPDAVGHHAKLVSVTPQATRVRMY